MVRYLAGELPIPEDIIDHILRAFDDCLELRGDSDRSDVELASVVRWIVERTMVPWGQVERTLMAMLTLSARLDKALGSDHPT